MRKHGANLQTLAASKKTEKVDGVHRIEVLKDSFSEGFEIETLWNTIETKNIRLNCRGTLELRYSGLEWYKKKAGEAVMIFGEQGKLMIIAEDARINIYTNEGRFVGSSDIFLAEGKLKVRLFSLGSKQKIH